jgi:hypothetical protein
MFEFIIHDHVLHYFKLNPNQHGFIKTKPTVANLVTSLNFAARVVAVRVKLMLSILMLQMLLASSPIVCSCISYALWNLVVTLGGFAVA